MEAMKIKVASVPFGDLIEELKDGEIRIPRFQREFVWGHKMTAALFDSMSREYPIGSFFLWSAPASFNKLIREVEGLGQAKLNENLDHRLILDGQQRLTSLYAVVHGLELEGVNYRNLGLDLDLDESDKNPFALRKFIDNQRYVSVSDLLSQNFHDIYEQLVSETRKKRFLKHWERLTKYPFSVVTVVVNDIEPAIDIFERINQEGQRLTRFDLVAAHVYDDDFDLRVRVEEDVQEKLRKKDFGALPPSIFPQTLVINLEKQVSFRSQIGLQSEEVIPIWDESVDALLKAIDWLRVNQGVESNKYLPYDQVVPVLAHYFFYCNKQEHHPNQAEFEQLKRWFWGVAFGERYGDSVQSRTQEDVTWIKNLVNYGEDVKLRFSVDEAILTETYMTQKSAVKNGVLCLLNLLVPQHFRTGEKVSLGGGHFSSLTKAERHHIFPVSFLENHGYAKRAVHRLPNFCFIPADLNKEIGSNAPSLYLRKYKEAHVDREKFHHIMKSHLMPIENDSAVWHDNYEEFLRSRAILILNKAKEFAGLTERREADY